MSDAEIKPDLVTVSIDGKTIQVPKGQNLIDAAASAGVDIPHYCYHPNLSIAGNCRMCQVEIQGSPKLGIACNTMCTEGLTVKTHFSSPEVAESQRATLEFLLINHPLDCTVCDQSGHCKLQDYYYEYNGKASRFIENKVHKVKAEVLGPNVIYDGERCIMCTRCVRFCEEVTETSELGAFNRGDKGEIGVIPGHELTNPLSGSVVDLCPVGALTHSKWRFNTRIWYTSEQNSVCPGCSTGCNVQAYMRDDQVVHIKARMNQEVNQEWLCDEGRYGFHRFQPTVRATEPQARKGEQLQAISWEEALSTAKQVSSGGPVAVFLSPFLTLEDTWAATEFAESVLGVAANSDHVAVQLHQRELTPTEAKLISSDYAPNARALAVLDPSLQGEDWRARLQTRYEALLNRVRSGEIKRVLLVGQDAIRAADVDEKLQAGLLGADVSIALTPVGIAQRQEETLAQTFCKVHLPSRTVNEKNGILVNRDLRLQRLRALLTPPTGSQPEWILLQKLAAACGKVILPPQVSDDRGAFREMVKKLTVLSGLTLARIGENGIPLAAVSQAVPESGQAEARA